MAKVEKNPGKTEKYPYKSAFSLFNDSKELVMKNLTPFLVLAAIPFFFSLVTRMDHNRPAFSKAGLPSFNGLAVGAVVGIGLVLFLASIVISIFIQIMMFVLETETAKGNQPTLDQVYEAAKKNWSRLFVLQIQILVRVLVGLILLIIPGLIAIRKYFLAPYAMLDKDLSVKEALTESTRLSKPHTGAIWGIIGVTLLIAMTSVVPLFGVIIAAGLSMLYSVAPALRYFELKKLVKEA